MARGNAAAAPLSPNSEPEQGSAAAPLYERMIPPETYRDREHYAARDACNDRNGVLYAVREALRGANGRVVRVAVFYE